MTWAHFIARTLSVFIVVPLVLRSFPAQDVALYFLLLSALAIQFVIAAGFTPTLARSISHALAGVEESSLGIRVTMEGRALGEPNRRLLKGLLLEMRLLFAVLGLLTFVLGATAGTWLIWEPLQASTSFSQGLGAWIVILAISPIVLWSQHLNAFLQGIDKIALEQRWAAAFALGATVSAVVVILAGGRVLALIVSMQVWQILGVIRNGWLVRRCTCELELPELNSAEGTGIVRLLWPQCWRAAVGTLASAGLIHLSGFFYARFAATAELATYVLGLRLIQMVAQASNAPFYSRIPFFNRLRAQGEVEKLARQARNSMRRSYSVFVILWTALLAGGAITLDLVGSQTRFPSSSLWILFGFAFFLERVGAMHIQLYSTTNHIVWHITNGVTAVIIMGLLAITWKGFGIASFPFSMLVANILFFVWYCARKSLRSIGVGMLQFERTCALPALLVMSVIAIAAIW